MWLFIDFPPNMSRIFLMVCIEIRKKWSHASNFFFVNSPPRSRLLTAQYAIVTKPRKLGDGMTPGMVLDVQPRGTMMSSINHKLTG